MKIEYVLALDVNQSPEGDIFKIQFLFPNPVHLYCIFLLNNIYNNGILPVAKHHQPRFSNYWLILANNSTCVAKYILLFKSSLYNFHSHFHSFHDIYIKEI